MEFCGELQGHFEFCPSDISDNWRTLEVSNNFKTSKNLNYFLVKSRLNTAFRQKSGMAYL